MAKKDREKVPFKTDEDERDVSDSDKERPGLDDELVDTDDER